jgi:hypothetical protein
MVSKPFGIGKPEPSDTLIHLMFHFVISMSDLKWLVLLHSAMNNWEYAYTDLMCALTLCNNYSIHCFSIFLYWLKV